MMRCTLITLATLIFWLALAPESSAGPTLDELAVRCDAQLTAIVGDLKTVDEGVEAAYCAGYMAASVDLLMLTTDPSAQALLDRFEMCLPDNLGVDTVVANFVGWREVTKKTFPGSLPGRVGVLATLSTFYPCRKE